MQVTFSKRTWTLIAVMMVLNLAVLTGVASGIIPDLLRLVASIAALIAIVIDWNASRQG